MNSRAPPQDWRLLVDLTIVEEREQKEDSGNVMCAKGNLALTSRNY